MSTNIFVVSLNFYSNIISFLTNLIMVQIQIENNEIKTFHKKYSQNREFFQIFELFNHNVLSIAQKIENSLPLNDPL